MVSIGERLKDEKNLVMKSREGADTNALERFAYHEGGHVLACVMFGIPIIKASIVDTRRGAFD